MEPSPRPCRVAAATAVPCLLLGLLLSPAYGPTWDAALGDYAWGERWLEYAHTFDSAWLDDGPDAPQPPAREPHLDVAPPGFRAHQIHPLGAVLSAFSCRVLWTWLGVVPPVAAHHMVAVLAAALLVFATAGFIASRAGALAGAAAGLFLASAPRFGAHAFNNIKDVPEACLYALASGAAYFALTGGGMRIHLAAGALAGLALAQKGNALFLAVQVPLLAAGLFALGRARVSPRGWLAAATAAPLAFLLASPPAWASPIEATAERFGEVLAVGRAADAGVSLHGLRQFAETTPLALLLCAALGLVASARARPGLALFLFLGVAVPVGRTAMPGMRNFDGVRHFLEFYPFLAALAGLGLGAVAIRLPRRLAPLALFALVPVAWSTARAHPNGVAWFNAAAGGLGGAQARGELGATDYWANSYWQGLAWLDEHAEPGAGLVVPVAHHVARASAPLRLRADLVLHAPQDPALGEVTYVMYVTRANWYGPFVRELERVSEPVHEIRVQNAPILRIHRLASGASTAAALLTRARAFRAEVAGGVFLRWALEQRAEARPAVRLLEGARPGEPCPPEFLGLVPPHLRDSAADLWWYAGEAAGQAPQVRR